MTIGTCAAQETLRIWAWFKSIIHRPKQLHLPFWCGNYDEPCEFIHDSTTGFYGRCWKCGVEYDPGCDR